ncbi:MAG: hypothetical protein CL764_02700 [Chloroflexi bacterium]|nr:hypothetical protein [Chloroflexota bacterium]
MTIKENIMNLKITMKDLLFILPLIFSFILIIFMLFDNASTKCDWSIRDRWECYSESDKNS